VQNDYQTPGTLESFLSRMKDAQQKSKSKSKREGEEEGYVVHLVGTGPGDPELLTLKAVRLMQQADVVLYDRLISSEVLEYVNKDCLMVYVGKERGLHTRSQGEIHQLLYEFCTAGATVVRLKGGDPYVFGRGGEELEYLQERGVDVHCVPGITAASGISSALGIPLTHRGIADNVQFITGHLRGEFTGEKLKELANKVAYENTTIVIYMGLNSLPQMSQELIEHGMDPQTASVAVERGTMKNQRTVFSPLQGLAGMVEEAELESPTLIVIGNVVTLCSYWQDKLHLASPKTTRTNKAETAAADRKSKIEGEEGPLLV
jgi:uroporphyrin-III C-methyltransferase